MGSEGSLLHLQEPATCPYPVPAQSSPWPLPSHSLKIHFNIISHLRLGLPSGLPLSVLPTKILQAPLLYSIRATSPAHLIVLDLIICDEYRSLSFSLCNLLHTPVTSCVSGPNILFGTLFSNTLLSLVRLSQKPKDYINFVRKGKQPRRLSPGISYDESDWPHLPQGRTAMSAGP
jgi:hypothetical protein